MSAALIQMRPREIAENLQLIPCVANLIRNIARLNISFDSFRPMREIDISAPWWARLTHRLHCDPGRGVDDQGRNEGYGAIECPRNAMGSRFDEVSKQLVEN